jgi:hypothetical protein
VTGNAAEQKMGEAVGIESRIALFQAKTFAAPALRHLIFPHEFLLQNRMNGGMWR